jgi:hypothetical protein
MVMHSSPIEWFESIDCRGGLVEEMTTAECEKCPMALSNYTFTSAPELLAWADGNINVMFCVKEGSDLPRAITTVLESGASHRAFLEIGVTPLLDAVNANASGWDMVWYILGVSSHDELASFLATNPAVVARIVLVEFNDYTHNWDDATLAADLAQVHALGRRAAAATRSNPATATVKNNLDIYKAGIDVAYTYNLANAVEARKIINNERGIYPA